MSPNLVAQVTTLGGCRMRASTQEQTGAIGANEVAANFERINWGPVPNSYHDLGTDLLVQVRDSRLFDRGILVGVQVKGGPSFFEEPEKDDADETTGWWYRENSATHFEDWVTHDLPHLLVLHDTSNRVSYWVHVTSTSVITTGRGAKVLVPRGQTIDLENSDALLNVAASRRSVISYEGSQWVGGAASISPARRLRHALIAPRLIAPHRNSGFSDKIGPLEAISLLCEGRIRDLDIFTEKQSTTPSPADALTSKDWLWRFYGALYLAVSENKYGVLQDSKNDAYSAEQRSAACVTAACMLMEEEKYNEALSLLSEEIERDEATPTDFAWLLTQRGRLRAETGDVAGAREDAARAQRELIGTTDDITASAIKSAAASLLFDTASWDSKEIADLATANDTTTSWWRSRNTSIGLSQFFDDTFQTWAGESSRKVNFEDIANNRLFAARLNAHLSGEQGVWRSLSSLLARHTLMMALDASDHSRSTPAINELRCSGDANALEKTLRKIRRIGPLSILKDAVENVPIIDWTHATARCNLALWQICGDLLNHNAADQAAQQCLEVLKDASEFVARVRPTFVVNYYVPRALAGLLPACSDQLHKAVAKFVAGLEPLNDILTVESYSRFVNQLRLDAVTDGETSAYLRQAAATQPDPKMSHPITAILSRIDDTYRQKMLEGIAQGDLDALVAYDDLNKLNKPAAAAMTKLLKERLEKILDDAKKGSHSLYAVDTAGLLSLINGLHPECAQWDIIIDFLKADKIPHDAKRQTYISIAHHISSIPNETLNAIRDIATSVPIGLPEDGFFGAPAGGAPAFFAIAAGALNGDALKRVIAQLLNGSTQERADAAGIMSELKKEEYSLILVALLDDRSESVRISAANALAAWAADKDSPPNVAVEHGFTKALRDKGFQIPLAVATAVANSNASRAEAAQMLEPLKNHPSALVRERVAQASRDQSQTE